MRNFFCTFGLLVVCSKQLEFLWQLSFGMVKNNTSSIMIILRKQREDIFFVEDFIEMLFSLIINLSTHTEAIYLNMMEHVCCKNHENKQTQASDIYSLGIILWIISVEVIGPMIVHEIIFDTKENSTSLR
ncbi:hypothetical protein RCL_jg13866.t1 [Rhizophagus clarus]|uniref:Protein kinase domain-containing protein n=1 Tax=Rhizophagus clarus TaxID=94130 RepID=A0A8H3LTJ4_9GLOM|nr:hypothetical protein RCL_jg13866.t1 [Rhizophagus clarus]